MSSALRVHCDGLPRASASPLLLGGGTGASARLLPRRPAAPDARGPADQVAPSGVGFMLVDASLHVQYANSEAVRILTYPGEPTTGRALDGEIAKKVRAQLENCAPSIGQPTLTELSSGRRRYLCRFLALGPESGSSFTTASFQPRIVVLIERGHRAFMELARIGEHYHLTPREREAMALLLRGLTTKQIAERMHVSPNTVKEFLRLIMLRMSVSTRSGIVGKILANAFDPL